MRTITCICVALLAGCAATSRVNVVHAPDRVGLANDHVAVSVDRNTGELLDIHRTGAPSLIEAGGVGLWQIELTTAGEDEAMAIDSRTAELTQVTLKRHRHGATIELFYDNVSVDHLYCDVHVIFELDGDDRMVRGRMNVNSLSPGARLWQVSFPQVMLRAANDEPAATRLLIPHRRGMLRTLGDVDQRYEVIQPYPSSSAHYQFVAFYGEQSGEGMYLATHDERCYSKTFREVLDSPKGTMTLAIDHVPANRGIADTPYTMPYDVRIAPYQGNWWHAARMYRQWWVTTHWASRGLIRDRKDLPHWLTHAVAAVRFSTTGVRTVEANMTAGTQLQNALDGAPTVGIWYGVQDRGEDVSLDNTGHGHHLPPKPGIVDALRNVTDQNMHLQAYIQSLLYDTTVDETDTTIARHYAITNMAGEPEYYAYNDKLFTMCRATGWWQVRVASICAEWIDHGFEGIYLDSFGRGSAECFNPDHGHAVGGGDTAFQGQRAFASKVKRAIRARNPHAILSGEAPTEGYRDILDLNLYAINCRSDSPPVFRAIWGDYSLGHGRTLRPSKTNDNWVPELAYLFVEGTIPGRIFNSGGSHWFLQPEHADDWAYLQKLMAYTEVGIEYLRFGEYLEPLKLEPQPPMVTFTEGVLNRECKLPAVMHSVTRSYADGSVAVVLVNVDTVDHEVTIPFNPSWGDTIERMNEAGELAPFNAASLTLAPSEVAFLIVR